MKKSFTLGIVLFVLALTLTGCATVSYEETEIEATVVECTEGTFYPNAFYQTKANMCLAEKNVAFWKMYNDLATEYGTYDYNITINIDGANYIIVRSEQYEIGEQIVVTQVNTYKDSQLVKTEYK